MTRLTGAAKAAHERKVLLDAARRAITRCHLTYVTYGGPHYCLTCGVTVGPTWQAKAAHAGVLRKDKTP